MPRPPQQLKAVVRSATAPARNYINNHFEMTKAEVRAVVAQVSALNISAPVEARPTQPLLELADVVAETSLFQSRMIADTRAEIAEVRAEIAKVSCDIAELSALVDRVVEVVAAMNISCEPNS